MEKGKVVDAEQILAENIKYEAKHAPSMAAPQDIVSPADLTENATVDDIALADTAIADDTASVAVPTEEDLAEESQ